MPGRCRPGQVPAVGVGPVVVVLELEVVVAGPVVVVLELVVVAAFAAALVVGPAARSAGSAPPEVALALQVQVLPLVPLLLEALP